MDIYLTSGDWKVEIWIYEVGCWILWNFSQEYLILFCFFKKVFTLHDKANQIMFKRLILKWFILFALWTLMHKKLQFDVTYADLRSFCAVWLRNFFEKNKINTVYFKYLILKLFKCNYLFFEFQNVNA